MGYAVLHLEKAKGADSGMSAHIERTIQPKNADPTRTHLNRELIQFPDGVRNRTAAIQHRLGTAGLKRKIGKNQVQAIRIVLTGTHADMERIEQGGKLGVWCQDNIDWLRKTYGADNVVSAVLHMDEETPHIHATIVPIVQTERKKQKKEQAVKKKYRTKAPAPRLCADEVMSRANLIRYQDTYAERMAAYGLQRGVKGSEAQHISTHEYYRSLIAQGEDLQANITQLLAKEAEARERNRAEEQHQQEVSNLKRLIDKAYKWFPSFKRFLNMERECLDCGFNEVQTDKLPHGQTINYSGWLHSNEYRRNALADNVTAQVIMDGKRNLFLHINETPIAQWFKEQFGFEYKQRKGMNL